MLIIIIMIIIAIVDIVAVNHSSSVLYNSYTLFLLLAPIHARIFHIYIQHIHRLM